MAKKTKAHQIYKTSAGKRVSGATTVIGGNLGWNKNVLMAWARREAMAGNDPDKIRDNAADIGTLCHYMAECHIKNEEPDIGDYSKNDIDKAENGFLKFLEWEKKMGLEYVDSELMLVSDKYEFGGTIDLMARSNNELYLIDFKTSKGIYPDHKIQLAAYFTLYVECLGVTPDKVHILKFSKDDTGSFEDHNIGIDELRFYWKIFEHCLALHKLKKEGGL